MTVTAFPRPASDEYGAWYAGYVAMVPDGDLLETMLHQVDDLAAFVSSAGEARGDHAYAEGKWTIKEVLAHLVDAERIFAYRALRIARGDQTPLPGFDEKSYAPESLASTRTLAGLSDEFALLRRSNLAMFRTFTPAVAARLGTASNNPVSARAIAWIMAGHAAHHLTILRERYLQTG